MTVAEAASFPIPPAAGPTRADAIDAALRAIVEAARSAWVDGAGLREQVVPAEFSHVSGSIGEQPVLLHTRRYAGDAIESLTLATISTVEASGTGRLCSATVIGLPGPRSLLPVLGVDVVAIRGALSLVALDLAPLDDDFFTAHAAPILREVGRLGAALPVRKRPEFADASFSPLALIAGARPGQEPAVVAATAHLLHASAALLGPAAHLDSGDRERAAAVQARNRAWRRAELQNRKEHNALARIFGAEFARRYGEEFLFAPPPDIST